MNLEMVEVQYVGASGVEKKAGAVVAAGGEEGEDGEGVDGVDLVARGEKGKVAQKDAAACREDHELMEGTVDVVDGNQTAAVAVEYQLLVAVVVQMPWQSNHEVVDPSTLTMN